LKDKYKERFFFLFSFFSFACSKKETKKGTDKFPLMLVAALPGQHTRTLLIFILYTDKNENWYNTCDTNFEEMNFAV